MPGRPPAHVARCRPGLPTVEILMCSWRLAWMASRPKKVKNRLASMPSARAPLAMIRPGYTPSSEPFEMMIETFSMVSAMVSAPFSDAAARLGNPGDPGRDLGRAFGEQLVQLLHRHARGLSEHPHGGAGAVDGVFVAHEADDLPVRVGQGFDAFPPSKLRSHLLRPLLGVDEESLV